MKKLLITFILILFACCAAYFLYYKWYLPFSTDAWQMIPNDAIIIIESSDALKSWNDLKENSLCKDMESIPFLQRISNSIRIFDSLITDHPDKKGKKFKKQEQNYFDDFFADKDVLISLHLARLQTNRVKKPGLLEDSLNFDLDYLFFFPLKKTGDNKIVKYLIKQFSSDHRFKINSRDYKGFNITEIADANSQFGLSLIIYRNYFIAGTGHVRYLQFLIEDVIHKINKGRFANPFSIPFFNFIEKIKGSNEPVMVKRSGNSTSLSALKETFEQYWTAKDQYLHVYCHYKYLPLLLSAFNPQSHFAEQVNGYDGGVTSTRYKKNEYSALSEIYFLATNKFAIATALDLSFSDNKLLLNGFTLTSLSQTDRSKHQQETKHASSLHYLSIFNDQSPKTISFAKYVPNTTSVLLHYAFDDGIKLDQSLINLRGRDYIVQKNIFKKKYGFDISNIFGWLYNEIGLCVLKPIKKEIEGIEGKEGKEGEGVDRILFLKVKNIKKALSELEKLADVINEGNDRNESRNPKSTRLLNIKEFPYKVFGDPFIGFDKCFFAVIDNYIVLANSQQAIKRLFNSIKNENTWGKNVQQSSFLDQSLSEANLTLIMNIPKNLNTINKFEHLTIQFANIEPPRVLGVTFEQDITIPGTQYYKFYTSIVLQYQPIKKEIKEIKGIEEIKEIGETEEKVVSYKKDFIEKNKTELDFHAITKPYLVKNHYDNSIEIFLQDERNQIYLISKSGKILFKKSLSDPIVSDVFQVDMYKNSKLQCLFATANKIYIFDRKGNIIRNYPIRLPDSTNIQLLTVIDYDKSKNYRFLVSDHFGNILMFNKEGKNLDGWNPKKFPARHCFITHIRIAGKDCIITVQQDGIVNILSRVGIMRKGFPLDLKGNTISPLYIKTGKYFSNTYFTTITKNGLLVKFNLNGEIILRKQLARGLKEIDGISRVSETTFELCIDALKKDWIIVRQNDNKLALFDSDLNLIFNIPGKYLSGVAIQYYNFSIKNKIYVITNLSEGKTHLYDHNGNHLIQPFENSNLIALIYHRSSQSFDLYKVNEDVLSLNTFEF